MLDELAALGIRIAIDDYGTGYSSLAYLHRLPVQELKIDRSFVTNLPNDLSNGIIVRSSIAMAHSLGLSVVAEGAEDEVTCVMLADSGCDLIQGDYLSKPMAPEELMDWLLAGAELDLRVQTIHLVRTEEEPMEFDAAVAEFVQAVRGGDEPTSDAVKCIIESLNRMLTFWFRGSLNRSDRSDVVSEAVLRFTDSIRREIYQPEKPPAPYLTSILRHAGTDHISKNSLQRATDPYELENVTHPGTSDEIYDSMASELLNRVDAVAAIASALDKARANGDEGCIELVRVWLGLSEREGRGMTSREVASKLGMSHTEAQRRLRRFRGYLDDEV